MKESAEDLVARIRKLPVLDQAEAKGLLARIQAGRASSDQRARLDALLAPPAPPEPKSKKTTNTSDPTDLPCKTAKALANAAGIHQNTFSNWKRQGITIEGPPYSLKAFFLVLRRHGRLGDCKPQTAKAHKIKAWAWGTGDAGDPDDPTHGTPQGWREEIERQKALKEIDERRKVRLETETLAGERIPIDLYRERWRQRAQVVLGALESFMQVVPSLDAELTKANLPPLTTDQRAALGRVIRQQVQQSRDHIAKPLHGA
jgi:hypothetical protein